MALQFSHAVGYRGINILRGHLLLCTGGNINLTQDPIMGSGVWGAGYANIAPIAYAWNYLSLEGSSNFELTTDPVKPSNGAVDLWTTLKQACITDRTQQSWVTLFPDGRNGFTGKGWCSSLSFDASEGSAVTGTYNFKGDPDPRDSSGKPDTSQGVMTYGDWTNSQGEKADGVDDVEFTHGKSKNYRITKDGHTIVQLAGSTLVPYWRTSVRKNCAAPDEKGAVSPTSGTHMSDIISWNCSYNSDLQMLKCCNLNYVSPLSADYILCGEATAEGSYTVFRIASEFAPGAYHSVKKNLTFFLNMSEETEPGAGRVGAQYGNDNMNNITIPYVLVNSGSTSMTTGAQYVTCEFSFNGIGNGVDPIVCMSNGLYDGEDDNP